MAFLTPGEIAQTAIQIGTLGVIVRIFIDAKRNGKKENGSAKPCPLHESLAQRTTEAKAETEKIDADLTLLRSENRDDHKGINQKLDTLTGAVASASAAAASAASAAALIAARRKG